MHKHMAEASMLYREAVNKQVASLHLSVQGTSALAQGLSVEADRIKRRILSAHIVPSLSQAG
jgi:hypothetical protein